MRNKFQNFRRVTYSTKTEEVFPIWYILHCEKGNEWKVLDACKKNISNRALKEGFVFTYDRMRKYHGEWHLEKNLMFPACIFLESKDEALFAEEMEQYERLPELSKAYGEVLPVKESEKIFLISLCGGMRHLGMSKGVIRDGVTYITEGPLWGMENRICRIDRHKRLARIMIMEKPISGEILTGSKAEESFSAKSILAGLEIVEKN